MNEREVTTRSFTPVGQVHRDTIDRRGAYRARLGRALEQGETSEHEIAVRSARGFQWQRRFNRKQRGVRGFRWKS